MKSNIYGELKERREIISLNKLNMRISLFAVVVHTTVHSWNDCKKVSVLAP